MRAIEADAIALPIRAAAGAPAGPRPTGVVRPSPTLDRLVALARLAPSASVAVAGPAALPATLGLIRMGFERAACVCGRCGAEAGGADALLLTGPLTGEAAAALAPLAGAWLQPRGVVAVHEASLDGEPGLMRALGEAGWDVDWVVHDLSRACLAALGVHRRAAPAPGEAPVSSPSARAA